MFFLGYPVAVGLDIVWDSSNARLPTKNLDGLPTLLIQGHRYMAESTSSSLTKLSQKIIRFSRTIYEIELRVNAIRTNVYFL